MSYTDKHIIETYSGLFFGLSTDSKLELIETLTQSIKNDNKGKEARFYKSFGAFASEKAAEVIVKEIKASRKFKHREIKL